MGEWRMGEAGREGKIFLIQGLATYILGEPGAVDGWLML